MNKAIPTSPTIFSSFWSLRCIYRNKICQARPPDSWKGFVCVPSKQSKTKQMKSTRQSTLKSIWVLQARFPNVHTMPKKWRLAFTTTSLPPLSRPLLPFTSVDYVRLITFYSSEQKNIILPFLTNIMQWHNAICGGVAQRGWLLLASDGRALHFIFCFM